MRAVYDFRAFHDFRVLIDKKSSQEMEINVRVEKTWKPYYVMSINVKNKPEIATETRMKILKIMYKLILIFWCESWCWVEGRKRNTGCADEVCENSCMSSKEG